MMTRFERAVIITVPQFPKINALDAWRTAVCRALASASGYVDNQEIMWFNDINAKTFQQLGEDLSIRRFAILEQPLAAALMKTVPEQLKVRIHKLEADAILKNKLITGRQIAWKILEWFKTDAYHNTYSTLTDLANLAWKGDLPVDMETFLTDWDYLVKHLPPSVSEEQLRDICFSKWENTAFLHRMWHITEGQEHAVMTHISQCRLCDGPWIYS